MNELAQRIASALRAAGMKSVSVRRYKRSDAQVVIDGGNHVIDVEWVKGGARVAHRFFPRPFNIAEVAKHVVDLLVERKQMAAERDAKQAAKKDFAYYTDLVRHTNGRVTASYDEYGYYKDRPYAVILRVRSLTALSMALDWAQDFGDPTDADDAPPLRPTLASQLRDARWTVESTPGEFGLILLARHLASPTDLYSALELPVGGSLETEDGAVKRVQ